jgi:hypothetical protein
VGTEKNPEVQGHPAKVIKNDQHEAVAKRRFLQPNKDSTVEGLPCKGGSVTEDC